jgi:flagellar biosynthesis protein FliP
LAKQNNLDTETLATLRHPENDLKFAKQQFFKALTGTSFFVRGSGAPTVFTFESTTIKYWLDEIISIDDSKDKLEEEIQVFLDKQTSKRREDILVELDKLDIKLDNQREDVE